MLCWCYRGCMAARQAVQSRYRVRPARPQDVGALAQVHVASWHHAYQGILAPHNLALTNYPRSLGRFRGYFWRGGQRSSLMHVAETDEGVVGYVNSGACSDRGIGARGEVFELYLHPDFHGEGAGRKLLSAGLWALSGYKLLPAIVWVLADNHAARRFYEGMRGREVAHGKVVVGDQLLDKVAYAWVDYLPWPEWAL